MPTSSRKFPICLSVRVEIDKFYLGKLMVDKSITFTHKTDFSEGSYLVSTLAVNFLTVFLLVNTSSSRDYLTAFYPNYGINSNFKTCF